MFQCPHCHAWEVRERAFGYLAPDEQCADWSLLLRTWTADLIVFTSGRFEPPALLREAGIPVETREVIGLRAEAGKLVAVQLADGREVARDVLFVRPPQVQTPLVQALGVRLAERDLVATDNYQTSIAGIYGWWRRQL